MKIRYRVVSLLCIGKFKLVIIYLLVFILCTCNDIKIVNSRYFIEISLFRDENISV